ncbi:unnamed protein product [Heligmosomoides polygyrus]|uniref:Reverse transcriptase domain-containing protein n=1 Tax=Heligmosomoides polygyrus TaxID=6339 RepID=A0A3P7ZUR5_HELPZ|nr:unnamed protein product [Heligmosomoides polygyrus]
MKIFERIVDGRIRKIGRLSIDQCGFVAGCGTIDTIDAVRLLVERHREKQKPLHLAFPNLEKAFDRVPREVIWYALRKHGVLEGLIEWVRLLYSCPKSHLRAPAGTSTAFPISVGVHQEAYSLDTASDKAELERQVQAWYSRLAAFGLKLNVKKFEYLTTDVDETGSIEIEALRLYERYISTTLDLQLRLMLFNFDIRQLNWDSYLFDYVMGIKRYILKDDLGKLQAARANLTRMRMYRALLTAAFWYAVVQLCGFDNKKNQKLTAWFLGFSTSHLLLNYNFRPKVQLKSLDEYKKTAYC